MVRYQETGPGRGTVRVGRPGRPGPARTRPGPGRAPPAIRRKPIIGMYWRGSGGQSGCHRPGMDGAAMDDRGARSVGLLATLVRVYRTAAGLTQRQLASRAGVSPGALQDLEQGRTARPQSWLLDRLAEALQLAGPQRAELMSAPARQVPAGAVPAGAVPAGPRGAAG
jgi:DNA-binding XRE family transcriptional regulator